MTGITEAGAMRLRIEALERENAELRAAIEAIADTPPFSNEDAREMSNRARAALGAAKGGK